MNPLCDCCDAPFLDALSERSVLDWLRAAGSKVGLLGVAGLGGKECLTMIDSVARNSSFPSPFRGISWTTSSASIKQVSGIFRVLNGACNPRILSQEHMLQPVGSKSYNGPQINPPITRSYRVLSIRTWECSILRSTRNRARKSRWCKPSSLFATAALYGPVMHTRSTRSSVCSESALTNSYVLIPFDKWIEHPHLEDGKR
ncbi:hypothetical protein P3T43_006215 [Paraburkholderia sp. GAS41]